MESNYPRWDPRLLPFVSESAESPTGRTEVSYPDEYCHTRWYSNNGNKEPMIIVQVSIKRLFDIYQKLLLELFSNSLHVPANVVIASSHHSPENELPQVFVRDNIELPYLLSVLQKHADVVIHDPHIDIQVIKTTTQFSVEVIKRKAIVLFGLCRSFQRERYNLEHLLEREKIFLADKRRRPSHAEGAYSGEHCDALLEDLGAEEEL